MTAPLSSGSSHAAPFEDADSLNQDVAQEKQVGSVQPEDALAHPPAYRDTAMKDTGGQISNPTGFLSGVF